MSGRQSWRDHAEQYDANIMSAVTLSLSLSFSSREDSNTGSWQSKLKYRASGASCCNSYKPLNSTFLSLSLSLSLSLTFDANASLSRYDRVMTKLHSTLVRQLIGRRRTRLTYNSFKVLTSGKRSKLERPVNRTRPSPTLRLAKCDVENANVKEEIRGAMINTKGNTCKTNSHGRREVLAASGTSDAAITEKS